jgi:hypothetical protein
VTFEPIPPVSSTVSPLDAASALAFLECAEIEVLGVMPYASNATFLTHLRDGDREALAVYKPRRGERPLWDFPSGTLCLREVATWVLSHELGWNLVPPTILREGPAGLGALQLFIEEDEEADVRELPRTHPDELRALSLFDAVINNADRKAGHLIVDRSGKLWGVDHGVCFNEDPKLRTVLWVYEGKTIPKRLLDDLETFSRGGADGLRDLLSRSEIDALCERIATLLATRRFPEADPGRYHVPWPPW